MTNPSSISPSTLDLTDRVCIVTGASSGIGRAIARQFAANGAQVIIADVTEQVLEGGAPTSTIIHSDGGRAEFIHTDIANQAQVEELFSSVVFRYGRLDVLVNNACIRRPQPLLELDKADWQALLDVNLSGTYHCCQAAVRQMTSQPPVNDVRGRIINLSSQHGMIAAPGDLGYGTTKAAIDYMTRQIAVDYADQHIVCNCVAPGKIQTGVGGRATDPTVVDRATQRTPWPRLGRPQDVAQAVLFLASDSASFITGTTLMVDGGWMAA